MGRTSTEEFEPVVPSRGGSASPREGGRGRRGAGRDARVARPGRPGPRFPTPTGPTRPVVVEEGTSARREEEVADVLAPEGLAEEGD